MSRKSTWSVFAFPELRDRQAAAENAFVRNAEAALAQSVAASPLRRADLLDAVNRLRVEARELQRADLYWVTRRMTSVAVGAAETLPEWTPARAVPSPRGFLCWERAAGLTLVKSSGDEVSFDAALWHPDDSGRLVVHFMSRGRGSFPWPWEGSRVVTIPDPSRPRTEEVGGGLDSVPELSVLASAWLLMAQPRLVSTRAAGSAEQSSGGRVGRVDRPAVSVVDVRPTVHAAGEFSGRGGTVDHDHQWWVTGHWRQQVCGPGRLERKPIWIDPHLKGPEGAPIGESVRIWRS